jgi:rhodanese-related sulfurtransferase
MRSTVAQVVVLVVLAGGVGAYFAATRPPQLRLPESINEQVSSVPTDPNATAPAAPAVTPRVTPPAPVEPKAQPATAAPDAKAPATTTPAVPAATAPAAAKADKTDVNITLARAKEIYDAGTLDGRQVVFVDAREFREFSAGHIAGAMWLPKKHFDGAAPKKVLNYLPGSAVVVYCGGGDCTDSEAVVKRLVAMNLNIGPLFIMKDGFPEWQKAGHPVLTGAEVGFE